MKSKILFAASFLCLSMLGGCLDEVTEVPDLSELACTTETLDDDSGVKIICGGDSVGVVMNGKDGKDGKNGKAGKDGKDGTSCTVKENADNNGYDVFCDDEKFGSIKNGKDGKNGTDGEDGEKGDKGDKGEDGKDGGKGDTGKSAYEIAKDNGFTGTEKEWLEFLKGAAGENCKGEKLSNGNIKITCGSNFEEILGEFLSLTQSVSLFNLHTNIL